jgi:uncharacterized protein
MSSHRFVKSHHHQHAGERIVQHKRGILAADEQLQYYIQSDMPRQHSDFFSGLMYFPMSTQDQKGRPWTTILSCAGQTNFIKVKSDNELLIYAKLAEDDPFRKAVLDCAHMQYRYFAALGIDFSNRRRNKLSGFILHSELSEDGNTLMMHVFTTESMGNCPKYITQRELVHQESRPTTLMSSDLSRDTATAVVVLPKECRHIITSATTMFMSSIHRTTTTMSDRQKKVLEDYSDMGLNHRGGNEGFVRALDQNDTTYLVLPDYQGNNFFQSLGNIETDGEVGLVFPNFRTGDMLYITGFANNLYGSEAHHLMPGAEYLTKIRIDDFVLIKSALQLKVIGVEQRSPFNPPILLLACELEQGGGGGILDAGGEKNNTATLIKINPL